MHSVDKLDEYYDVILKNGMTVFIKPQTYSDAMKIASNIFEQNRLVKTLSNPDLDEMEKMKIFSKGFDKMVSLNIELMTNAIIKIVKEDDGLVVENTPGNYENIKQFLLNIDKTNVDIIEDKLKELNSHGLDKKYKPTCIKCEHSWETEIEFNPVNFSMGS
jgi:hypothetical protein